MRRLAHVSDLHLGAPGNDVRARLLCATLLAADVDHVVVTGDVTNRGLRAELAQFHAAFAPLIAAGRVTLVPGNHDRLRDDVARGFMDNQRVRTCALTGLYLVCVDSTAKHNRWLLRGHGALDESDLAAVDAALARAPREALVAVLLHHHPVHHPEEMPSERFATLIGWRAPEELELGWKLLELCRGRADLVLHGHRHHPRWFRLWPGDARPLGLYDGGSSTELGRCRVFAHAGGVVLGGPRWLHATPDATLADRPAAPSRARRA